MGLKLCKRCNETKPLTEYYTAQCYCKPCKNAIGRERYDPKKAKGYALKRFWPGSTPEEAQANYNQLFLEQAGICPVCTRHQSEFKKALCVDHNHRTGEVRGLLCDPCNQALGLLRDDPQFTINATTYLTERGY